MKSDVKTAFTTCIDLNRFQHPMTGLCPADDSLMRGGKHHHTVFLLSWNQEFEESLKHSRSTKSPLLRALKKVSRLCTFLFTWAIYLKSSIWAIILPNSLPTLTELRQISDMAHSSNSWIFKITRRPPHFSKHTKSRTKKKINTIWESQQNHLYTIHLKDRRIAKSVPRRCHIKRGSSPCCLWLWRSAQALNSI